VAKYLSIRYECLLSPSTSRNKAAKLFSDNALFPFRPALSEPPLARIVAAGATSGTTRVFPSEEGEDG